MSSISIAGDTSGSVILTVPAAAGSSTITLPAGTGTAAVQGVSTNIVSGTAQNTTSGTSITFTGIPSWAKRITVILSGVSTSGTSLVQVQIGSGSVSTSGYVSAASTSGANSTSTTGFLCGGNNGASDVRTGALVIYNISGFNYIAMGSIGLPTVNSYSINGSSPTLSGALDRVVLTTVNGTDTFDAGSVNIMYE